MITFSDLCDLLKKEDEVTLLEYLDLTSEQLVDLLENYIEDKQEHIRNFYYEDTEELGE